MRERKLIHTETTVLHQVRNINCASASPQTQHLLLDSALGDFCNPSPHPFSCDKHLTACDRPLAISQKSCSSGD